jgi:hypothetical protein
MSWINHVNFSSFSSSVRFASAQLASPPLFPIPGVVSPLADVITPSRHVTLISHWSKTSLLPPLHLLTTLYLITSPLESKLKHWIYTTATGYPPRTVRLSPSTAIKRSSHPWSLIPPLNHVSILPHPYPEHHVIGTSPAAIILFHHYLTPIIPSHNDTHSDKFVDPVSLPSACEFM